MTAPPTASPNALSFPQTMAINAIARWYPDRFPETSPTPRTISRVAAYPLTLPNGWPIQIQRLWPLLEQDGFTLKRDGDTVVAATGPGVTYTPGVGWCNVQIATGPFPDLHQLRAAHEAAVARLIPMVASLDAVLLGYGVQPMTIRHPGLIVDVPYNHAMLEAVGNRWLSYAVAATDVIQLSVGQDDLLDVLNLANLFSPVVIALCGNSPIYAMGDQFYCAGRQHILGELDPKERRQRMPGAPLTTLNDWFAWVGTLPFAVQMKDGAMAPGEGTFLEWVEAASAAGTLSQELIGAYLFHEDTAWPPARPRPLDGRVELRAACQQPWPDQMAAAALQFGIAEAGWALHDFCFAFAKSPRAPRAPYGVRQPPDPIRVPWDSWAPMVPYFDQAIHQGLDAKEPFTGLLEGTLQYAHNALAARGLGEEIYLQPLWERLARRENPAQRLRRLFARHGVDALVQALRIDSV
ncbi:MAG: glutamate-cysteine ligase family protein [Myxococcota bacterium]